MSTALTWRKRAACADVDPELFFPLLEDPARRAKAICARCPVREACLNYAVGHREAHGVWGGLLPGERSQLVAASRGRRWVA